MLLLKTLLGLDFVVVFMLALERLFQQLASVLLCAEGVVNLRTSFCFVACFIPIMFLRLKICFFIAVIRSRAKNFYFLLYLTFLTQIGNCMYQSKLNSTS